MTRKLLPALLVVFALAGCAQLPISPDGVPPLPDVVDVEAAIDESSRLSAEGRWQEAIDLVKRARRRFGDDTRLVGHLDQLVERSERVRRRIHDEILITNAEAKRAESLWLEELTRGQPGDLRVLSRKIFAREQLARQLPDVVACAEWHQETMPVLARRCHDLASELALDDAIKDRLAAVEARLEKNAKAAAEARLAQPMADPETTGVEPEAQRRARLLLAEAKAAVDAQDYRGALDTLDRVATLQPNNPEIANLRKTAEQAISPQVQALVKLGDHLYLDEQMEAALAAWQAALLLNPADSEIAARVDRAETVLKRLELLRQQQGR
jgi:tetratricopeptide (TPR) repeat protein